VIFVDESAVGLADGTSWHNAYTDLQDAIVDARDNGGCPCEIWVARGVYKPDRGTGDRAMSFELDDGVSLYGGFADWESLREQRDWKANETVLEGDLLGNDDSSYVASDPCCQYQYGSGCENLKCYAQVAAINEYCKSLWYPTCSAEAKGLCCDLCRPTRCDNTLHVVRLMDTGAGTTLDGFSIRGGEANELADSVGPAITALPTIGTVTARNCVFRYNAGFAASGIFSEGVVLDACVFDENLAFDGGPTSSGLIWAHPSNTHPLNIHGCTFLDNRSAAIHASAFGGVVVISDCDFVNNEGGIWVGNGVALVRGCQFLQNTGTALQTFGFGAALLLTDSILMGNHDGFRTGGAMSEGSALVKNCLFAGNTSGGGFVWQTGEVHPGHAGAFNSVIGFTRIENCAFVRNYADHIGGVSASEEGANVANSLFWNNADSYGSGEGAQLGGSSSATFAISDTIIQGWSGKLGGIGNSGDDPLFADPLGADNVAGTGDEDYRLSPDSPAIDAGAVTAYTPDTDLDGHARVLCGAVDLGPYEFGIGDYDCDREVNPGDFPAWTFCMEGPNQANDSGCEALDFNGDNRVDLSDFAGFQQLHP
jgi:hypothetical protein